jgi:hypothetical protein
VELLEMQYESGYNSCSPYHFNLLQVRSVGIVHSSGYTG